MLQLAVVGAQLGAGRHHGLRVRRLAALARGQVVLGALAKHLRVKCALKRVMCSVLEPVKRGEQLAF